MRTYKGPEMEITRFDDGEVATDVTIASGHRPGSGDLSYEDFI